MTYAAAPHGNLPDYPLPPGPTRQSPAHLRRQGKRTLWKRHLGHFCNLCCYCGSESLRGCADTAVRLSRAEPSGASGFLFLLLYLIAGFILDLPAELLYQHNLSLQYGLSVQGWASWFGDQAKSLAIGLVIGSHLALLLFWVIRKFPRRW